MKQYLKHWTHLALYLLLLGLFGCSSRGGDVAGDGALGAVEAPHSAPLQGKSTGRLLVWTASFTLEVADLPKSKVQITERLLALGAYVEESRDYGEHSQELIFRVPKEAFETALSSIEQGGKVLSRHVKGEDVTEQYVDVETRLRNNRALRDRLTALLLQAREVKDILQIETELNRIQSEIDSMEARMRVLGEQIQMSKLSVHLRQQEAEKPRTIYGPLGYLYKGAEWFITKLFIIRD